MSFCHLNYTLSLSLPQFIPSQAEAAIITDLYRRIGNAIDEPDLDTTDIYDEGQLHTAVQPFSINVHLLSTCCPALLICR